MSTELLLRTPTQAPSFGRLYQSELRRLAARRFTRVVLGLCVVGYLVAAGFIWQGHAKETAADLAQATVARDAEIVQIKDSIASCLAQAGNTASQCGTVPTADEFPPDQFLQNNPFRPEQVGEYATAVGAAVALVGFLLAATFIGAEWSSRNLVAWLFWEPRRLRLLGAKLLALSGVLLVLSVLAQLIWQLTARLLLDQRGLPVSSLGVDAAQFWPHLWLLQLRAALLVLPVAIIGFALANLMRNTAAALGVAFVYLAVVESVLRSISPALQPFLFTTNIQAWASTRGIDVFGDLEFDPAQNQVVPKLIHVSSTHGGVFLLVYAAVLILVSLLLFRRRDIT